MCLVSNVSPEMYIAGTPAVGFESRDVYCWCAHSTMQVRGCISLVCPMYDMSPGMYIAGVPTVESECNDVYRWCAQRRI